jgi:uncharacterized membrane protein
LSIKTYITALIVFFVIDLIWLGVIAAKLYRHYLGALMADKVNWPAALIFYGIFISGLVYFVIEPAMIKQSLSFAVGAGAFFGFITYATYDLTNLATLKDWPLPITIIDLIWGSVLSASVSGISYFILQKFQ